ncbi:MAG: four helix bundle protein [Bacteroidales bacterium]|jgi:four helix bundle protein|nr:four helix bundle protein [Bacteroidales bacterium]
MKDFKKLIVWQKSIELVTSIYKISKDFPSVEKYGLTSQVTRAAVSIPSNIAEGSSRFSERDYFRFLEIALGSAFELETQFIIIEKLDFVIANDVKIIVENIKIIQKMLSGLMSKLKRS